MTRRAGDLALTLGDALPRAPYRHVVITFPRLMGIRHRVREDPTLMRRLVRLCMGVLTCDLRRQARCHRHRREELAKVLPGAIVAWSSAGDQLNWHPHLQTNGSPPVGRATPRHPALRAGPRRGTPLRARPPFGSVGDGVFLPDGDFYGYLD